MQPGTFTTAFEYSDCWVDDARLVVLNARDAADRGAVIRTRTKVVSAEREQDGWRLTLADAATGRTETIAARALVNAAGPWVEEVLRTRVGVTARGHVRLVEGSHIVTRKLFDHDRAYIFQNADGRVVFAIPYEQDLTLIGTTERDYAGDPGATAATADEVAYLCAAASAAFARPVTPADVVWTYSGVRPLFDDGASEAKIASRDYVLEMNAEARGSAGAVGHRRQDHDLPCASPKPRLRASPPTLDPAMVCRRVGRGASRCPAATSTPMT